MFNVNDSLVHLVFVIFPEECLRNTLKGKKDSSLCSSTLHILNVDKMSGAKLWPSFIVLPFCFFYWNEK